MTKKLIILGLAAVITLAMSVTSFGAGAGMTTVYIPVTHMVYEGDEAPGTYLDYTVTSGNYCSTPVNMNKNGIIKVSYYLYGNPGFTLRDSSGNKIEYAREDSGSIEFDVSEPGTYYVLTNENLGPGQNVRAAIETFYPVESTTFTEGDKLFATVSYACTLMKFTPTKTGLYDMQDVSLIMNSSKKVLTNRYEHQSIYGLAKGVTYYVKYASEAEVYEPVYLGAVPVEPTTQSATTFNGAKKLAANEILKNDVDASTPDSTAIQAPGIIGKTNACYVKIHLSQKTKLEFVMEDGFSGTQYARVLDKYGNWLTKAYARDFTKTLKKGTYYVKLTKKTANNSGRYYFIVTGY